MKKLLFSLVAAAACGAVTADNVPATATFDSLTAEATFDVGKTEAQTVEIDGDNLGYWAVNEATDPELTVKAKSESDKYLSINTGSTPLWRTFTGIGVVASAKAGTLPAGVAADGKVVSSDVKLTACTEWPTLTDFANEKLALFLFAPEEGDTSGKTNGLYAVGGAMVGDPAVLTPTAYRLDVNVDSITNADGWATVAIKTYGDIYSGENNEKLQGFVIAVGATNSTLSAAAVVEADYAPGFVESDLTTVASTRIGNRTLIPATKVSDGTIAGLGFQGEGGIDNVKLFADDFATDADAMTVKITKGVEYEGITLDDGAFSFTSTDAVTINLKGVADKAVTADYGEGRTATVAYGQSDVTVTFTPVKDAILTIAVRDWKFQIGNVKYPDFAAILDAIEDEDNPLTAGEIDLLGDVSAGEGGLEFENGTFTIDLNGFTLSAEGESPAIYNAGAAITIIDSEGGGMVVGNIENAEGTLAIYAGTYEGTILTNEEGEEATYVGTTTIYGGNFAVKVEGATLVGGDWTQDGDYWTICAATPAPSIDAADGSIAEDADGDYVVTPAENVTEVDITVGDYTGNVIVPSTVTKITGTIAPAQIGVQLGAYKVIGAFKLNEANEIVLNKDATVKVGNEDISVEPELANTAADGETEVAPFEAGAEPAATVKTIPGLTYSLDFDSDVKGAFGTSAASKTADGNRMTLQDKTDKTGVTKRFYKIRVRK